MGLIDRVSTGVPGLDEMIEGGLPVPSVILLAFVEKRYFGTEIRYIDLENVIEASRSADDILFAIQSDLERFESRRVVIDSLSVIEVALIGDFRRFLLKFSTMIKEHKAVALITGDSMPGAPYPIEIARVTDGIILLQNAEVNMVRKRSIEVLKMCGTSHHLGKNAVDISVKGLTVYPGL
ncbi:MAG: ATPase domain-containing protein [Methanotrichaceae archaeon]